MTNFQISKELLNSFCQAQFKDSYFITFEGIEGAGKSSHINNLKSYLESFDYRVIVLREPGGTIFGEQLRDAMLNAKTTINPIAQAHLFAASRAQLLDEITLKELAVPKTIVIYDRYIDSSLAYQGKAGGLGAKTILEIHRHYPLNLMPNLTLYLRIGIGTSQERQNIRNLGRDYFESKGMDFYNQLIQGYEEALDLFPQRIKAIDAEGDMPTVYTQIKNEINKLISL